jgi:hypothetical protein
MTNDSPRKTTWKKLMIGDHIEFFRPGCECKVVCRGMSSFADMRSFHCEAHPHGTLSTYADEMELHDHWEP